MSTGLGEKDVLLPKQDVRAARNYFRAGTGAAVYVSQAHNSEMNYCIWFAGDCCAISIPWHE